MNLHHDVGKRRCLDASQIKRARFLHDSGWSLANVAADCGLSIPALQTAIGLPQWRDEPSFNRSEGKR